MSRLLWALIFASGLGCTEGVHQAEPVACDPLLDEGCAAGLHCRVLAGGGMACLAPSVVSVGCDPASCAPGEACVEVEGLRNCWPLCRLDAESCGSEGVCGYGLADDQPWGVCPPPCRLGGCPADGTCGPTTATPYPICVAQGPAQVGQECAQTRCAAGLACLQQPGEVPRCSTLCHPDAPSPCPGRCTGLIDGEPSLRFCAPELN